MLKGWWLIGNWRRFQLLELRLVDIPSIIAEICPIQFATLWISSLQAGVRSVCVGFQFTQVFTYLSCSLPCKGFIVVCDERERAHAVAKAQPKISALNIADQGISCLCVGPRAFQLSQPFCVKFWLVPHHTKNVILPHQSKLVSFHTVESITFPTASQETHQMQLMQSSYRLYFEARRWSLPSTVC